MEQGIVNGWWVSGTEVVIRSEEGWEGRRQRLPGGWHIEHWVRERTDGSGRLLVVEARCAKGPWKMGRAQSEGISRRQLT